MSATVRTEYSYPVTDTLNDEVNVGTLTDELNEAGLSVTVGVVSLSGSNVVIELLGDATSADLVLVDAVIAAHQGIDYVETPIFDYNDEAAVSDDTGSEIQIKEVETGPLTAGKHMVDWSAEVAVTSTSSGEAKVRFSLQREGKTEYSKGEFSTQASQWQHVSTPFIFHAADGQNFFFRIYLQRTGVAGNAARVRRSRVSVHKVY
jgi:hypothetical protein